MKKFLALVLALVMTMSLVTMGTSAAFTDAESIKYDEAVNTLVSLGVIEGMGGNTFAPESGVTRAQMAKMITFISLGVADATAFEGTETDLVDVDGHWAEAYIKYCYSQGIIAGKGNGKFDPDANVTTAEAAKMLLVALGWNADVQGYVGDQWKVNTVRDAFKSKVFDGISLGADKALNRDESAKLVYNTVLANTVAQTPTLDVDDGGVAIRYDQGDVPLLNKTFGAYRFVGQIGDISYNPADGTYTYYDVQVSNNDANEFEDVNDDRRTQPSFTTADDYTDLLLEEVSVVAKEVSTNKWEVLGIASTGAVDTKLVAKSSIGVSDDKMKIDGVKYSVEASPLVGYVAANATQTLSNAATLLADVDTGLSTAEKYDIVKIADIDKDGKLDLTWDANVEFAKVYNVSSTSVVTSEGTYKYADNEIAEGLAKDDRVYILKDMAGVNAIEKIEPVEAVLSGVNNDGLLKFNGEYYDAGDTGLDDSNIGSTYRVWILNGVVVDSKLVSGTSIDNLVMLIGVEDADSVDGNRAKYIDANGNVSGVVSVDESNNSDPVYDTAVDTASLVIGNLYVINKTDDGVEFVNPADADIDDYTWRDGGNFAAKTGSTKNYTLGGTRIADDAVVFVKTSNGSKVITGKQLKNMATSYVSVKNDGDRQQGYFENDGGSGLVSHIAVTYTGTTAQFSAPNGTELYAFVTSDAEYDEKINGTQYIKFSIWNGEEYVEVTKKGSSDMYKKGDVIVYESIVDGVITVNERIVMTPAAVSDIDKDDIFFDGSNSAYEKTSDTKILYVDSNASSAAEIGQTAGELQKATRMVSGETARIDNVSFAVATGNELEVLVIDIANMMTYYKNTGKVVGAKNYTVNDESSAQVGQAIDFDFDGARITTVWGLQRIDDNGDVQDVVAGDCTGKATFYVKDQAFADKNGDGKLDAVYFA